MKKSLCLILAFLVTVAAITGFAASTAAPAKSVKPDPGIRLAQSVTALTGVAISPLLGVSVFGAWEYFQTPSEKRAQLSFYARPWFWLLGLLIVAMVVAKDALGTVIPSPLKKPFDVAELFENKLSGLVAAGALVPMISTFLGRQSVDVAVSLSAAGFAAADGMSLGAILVLPFALVAYAFVWLASHAITILILLSPWGVVDAALKAFRAFLLSALAGLSAIDPWYGAILSLGVILVAYLVGGWSFRLLVQGTVFGWDFLTGRRKRFVPVSGEQWAFTSRKIDKVPIRTYGTLTKDPGGRLLFRYRPWLFLAERELPLGGRFAVGHGLFYPTMELCDGDEETRWFSFPPRYRTHEDELARLFGIEIRDVGLRGGMKRIGYWFRELFGYKTAAASAA